MHSSPLRKTKTLSKGAACITCKQRKVRCDALKPGCTACRRSARWRGEDPETVQCCYVERTSRRKGSNSHHVDLLRHASRESCASSEVSSVVDEPEEHAPTSPPSPRVYPQAQLPTFPIPSIPAITSDSFSSSFVLPELPSLLPRYAPDDTLPQFGLQEDCVMPPMDSLLGSDAPTPDPAVAPWTPSLYASDLLAQMDAIVPFCAAECSTLLPAYADGAAFVASPSALLGWHDLEAACPPLSPSSSSSSLHSSFSLAEDLSYALAASAPLPPSQAAPPPPPKVALPAFDPVDPFAAAFGEALHTHHKGVLHTPSGTLALPLAY
ncbi:hypothetical protein JCM10450v2_004401 [Rhodotorula kratochvilovae]